MIMMIMIIVMIIMILMIVMIMIVIIVMIMMIVNTGNSESEMDRDPAQIIIVRKLIHDNDDTDDDLSPQSTTKLRSEWHRWWLIRSPNHSLKLRSGPGFSAADVENVTQSPVS